MIIDSHCHAWARWPYQPPVPDMESRGCVEQLLHEMDLNSVDEALIVCAQIEHNPRNNDYVAEHVRRHPDRLHMAADVDCSWSETYHQPGAAERLREAAERWPLKAFTHYLRSDDDGTWLYSDEGVAFFQVAQKKRLIASIAGGPQHWSSLCKVAAQFPSIPFLLHHLAGAKADQPERWLAVLECAQIPNIYIKLSGFHYATAGPRWDFPHRDVQTLVKKEYEEFGSERMCWGSDFPVVGQFMTHRQSLEAFRTHCDFVSESEQRLILGTNLHELLEGAGE